MIDTRAGFWLQVAVVALTLLAVGLYCAFAKAPDRVLWRTLGVAVAPASILLPVLGVLLVTSEWSQRTAMVTFTLVPRRLRILAAKLAAGILVALAVMVVCIPLSALGMLFAGGTGDTWALSADQLGRITLSVVIAMLTGIALGALLLNSAPAIVLYFVLPFVTAALGAIPHVDAVIRWFDPTRTTSPLTDDTMSGHQWARLGTTVLLWIVVPLAVGAWRIARDEVQ